MSETSIGAVLTAKQTADAALLRAKCTEDELREWAYESHKDFTGMKGRWAVRAPIEEVITWIVQHFTRTETGDGKVWEFAFQPPE